MRRNFFLIIFIALLAIASAACGGGPVPANTTNINPANANSNVDNSLATTKPGQEPTVNNAPTLTPVYKAYCAAYVKKDEAALRKAYSSDSVADIQKQMKGDGIKTFVEYLSLDKLSNELCEVRNEQITGDSAIAEIRTNGYPNGIKVVFIKENGEWKMTNKSPALDSVKQSPANSDVGKSTASQPVAPAANKPAKPAGK